jgi:hypothetical protein
MNNDKIKELQELISNCMVEFRYITSRTEADNKRIRKVISSLGAMYAMLENEKENNEK